MSSHPVDEFIKCLLRLNELYAPLESRTYNFTYLSKIAMLPLDDPYRRDTILAIVDCGIRSILDTLDIPRLPHLQHKRLRSLIAEVISFYSPPPK